MSRRHRVSGYQLGRSHNHRKALFKNLIKSLVIQEEIKTTRAKAKSIQGEFDKLITKGKKQSVHARRLLLAQLGDKTVVHKIVDELVPRFGDRTSGFTRIIPLGLRRGDNAQIVKIQLVEKPAPATAKTKAKSKKTVNK